MPPFHYHLTKASLFSADIIPPRFDNFDFHYIGSHLHMSAQQIKANFPFCSLNLTSSRSCEALLNYKWHWFGKDNGENFILCRQCHGICIRVCHPLFPVLSTPSMYISFSGRILAHGSAVSRVTMDWSFPARGINGGARMAVRKWWDNSKGLWEGREHTGGRGRRVALWSL